MIFHNALLTLLFDEKKKQSKYIRKIYFKTTSFDTVLKAYL